MAKESSSDLPTLGVVLDLDTYERPKGDIKPPFIVKIGGRDVSFKDPGEIDWSILATVDGPGDLVRVSLTQEDREHVASVSLPTWKFSKLMEAYYVHYDMQEKIEEAKRRQQLGF